MVDLGISACQDCWCTGEELVVLLMVVQTPVVLPGKTASVQGKEGVVGGGGGGGGGGGSSTACQTCLSAGDLYTPWSSIACPFLIRVTTLAACPFLFRVTVLAVCPFLFRVTVLAVCPFLFRVTALAACPFLFRVTVLAVRPFCLG